MEQKRKAYASEDHHGWQDTKEDPIQLVWKNVFMLLIVHVVVLYGLVLSLTQASWKTILYGFFLAEVYGLSITAGAHRLWAHRSYKAKLPLRIFLATIHFVTFQNSLYQWVRNHRMHHKFDGTNADPHNINRGFFFAHVGWVMAKKHKDVIEKGKKMDFSDLMADPVVRIQHKIYHPVFAYCCVLLFTAVPFYFWDERWDICLFGNIAVLILEVNASFCINSFAHIWGVKPYNLKISATESHFLSALTTGEGFHNYHHTFPWDYSAGEFGYKYNLATFFIDCMAYIGQAYDLKKASSTDVYQCKIKNGDNSYFEKHEN